MFLVCLLTPNKCKLCVFFYKLFIITHGIAYKPTQGNSTLIIIIDSLYFNTLTNPIQKKKLQCSHLMES